jgi:putative endonuclease
MKSDNKKFGDEGEEIARKYLLSNGYSIEAVNWRKSRFELDIVASKEGLLVFIEVKSSRRNSLGPPEFRVNKIKQKRIAEAASEYLSELSVLPENIRFDVIGILSSRDKPPEINHIESAFVIEEEP